MKPNEGGVNMHSNIRYYSFKMGVENISVHLKWVQSSKIVLIRVA